METKNKNIKTFAQHLDKRYGQNGSKERVDFEIKAKAFAIGELIKEERKLAHLTQEQLADKIGAKKSPHDPMTTIQQNITSPASTNTPHNHF